MPALFLLFSHFLTTRQEQDAYSTLKVREIHPLPPELQARWSQVPPELEAVTEYAQPIWDWLKDQATPGDYVLVQGDFGMSHATVEYAKTQGLLPVYATTRRKSQETKQADGSVKKTLVFDHVRFRRY
jgi:D-arabinose 1-dehydrogenase-like Zn-dependent alcohol dehydrogenase